MRRIVSRLAVIACGIAAAAAIAVPASAASGPPAHVKTPALHARTITPAFTKVIDAKFRCVQFTGSIEHGGDGSIANPGFIIVRGQVRASCAGVQAWAQVGWHNLLEAKGPFVLGKKIRGISKFPAKPGVLLDQHDRVNTYSHIFLQVCITVRKNGENEAVCGPHITA